VSYLLKTYLLKTRLTVVTTRPHLHSHEEKKEHPHADQDGGAATTRQLRGLALFFEAHFGEVELHMPETSKEELELGEDDNEPSLLVTVDDSIACINLVSMVS
jgi:cleavage and polyadenylation specificity factor subunit 3